MFSLKLFNKKVIILLVLSILTSILLVLFIFGYNIKGPSKPKADIVFGSDRTDLANTVLKNYLVQFSKKNPTYDVELEVMENYSEAIKVKMASNSLPDVWMVNWGKFSKDTLANFCMEITDPEMVKDALLTNDYSDTDGRIYALPAGFSALGVVYNKKVYEKFSLRVPQTLNELVQNAKILEENNITGIATIAGEKWPVKYYWSDIGKLISGDVWINARQVNFKQPFTTMNPIALSYGILERFNNEKIIEQNPLSSKWNEIKKAFSEGRIGMTLLMSSQVPSLLKGNEKPVELGFFPFPYDNNTGSRRVLRRPETAFAISKQAKNKAVAMAFFKFIAVDQHLEYAKECGYFPARQSSNTNVSYLAEYLSYPQSYLEDVVDTERLTWLLSETQINDYMIAESILKGEDKQKVFTELNQKWNNIQTKK